MFNLLIVDDEQLICESLKIKVQAAQMPEIGEIYLANNGITALERLEQHSVQLILTDVKMPKMDGLQFMKAIKSKGGNYKFIVSSGYDDYPYVREAFQLGAMDYILKPASVEDIKEKLLIAIEAAKEEERIRKYQLTEKEKHQIENIKKALFAPSNVEEKIDGSSVFPYSKFCVGAIIFAKAEMAFMHQDKIQSLWKEKEKLIKEISEIEFFSFWAEEYRFYIILNFNSDLQEGWFAGRLTEFLLSLKGMEYLESCMVWGVQSTMYGTREELHTLYKQTEQTYEYHFLYPVFTILQYSQILKNKKRESILSKSQIQNFTEQDVSESISIITQLITEIITYEKLVNYSMESIKQLFDIFIEQTSYLRRSLLFTNDMNNMDVFKSFHSITDMRTTLLQEIYDLKRVVWEHKNQERTISSIAKKYIKENIGNDIDMSVVANMVSMNYTYFSELFKQETGTTFREYITKIRMEAAKRKLDDPLNKISEVAAQVGYENPKNFARAFHNYFGISPTGYRGQK